MRSALLFPVFTLIALGALFVACVRLTARASASANGARGGDAEKRVISERAAPLFSFGIVSDIHTADRFDEDALKRPRYFRGAISRVGQAFDEWLEHGEIGFVLQLGDVLDGSNALQGKTDWSLERVRTQFERLSVFSVVGNHELLNFHKQRWAELLAPSGTATMRSFFSFSRGNWRFVGLDAFDSEADPAARPWRPSGPMPIGLGTNGDAAASATAAAAAAATATATAAAAGAAAAAAAVAPVAAAVPLVPAGGALPPQQVPTGAAEGGRAATEASSDHATPVDAPSSLAPNNLGAESMDALASNLVYEEEADIAAAATEAGAARSDAAAATAAGEQPVQQEQQQQQLPPPLPPLPVPQQEEVAPAPVPAVEPQLPLCLGSISDLQLSWLEGEIEEAAETGQRVIVFSHLPLLPRKQGSCVIRNSEEVLDVLHGHFLHDSLAPEGRGFGYGGIVAAVFSGAHRHDGWYAVDDLGLHHVALDGLVGAPPSSAPAVATARVYSDRIELVGPAAASAPRVLLLAPRPGSPGARGAVEDRGASHGMEVLG